MTVWLYLDGDFDDLISVGDCGLPLRRGVLEVEL